MSALDQPHSGELSKFREMLYEYWENAYKRADYNKEPNEVDVVMAHLYRDFGPNARRLCNTVLAEWLESSDQQLRFTAFALIRRFQVVSAAPALQKFIATHSNPESAPERSELEKAKHVLGLCTANDLADLERQEHSGD